MEFIKKIIKKFRMKCLTRKLAKIIESGKLNAFVAYMLAAEKWVASVIPNAVVKNYVTIDDFINKFSPMKVWIKESTGELVFEDDTYRSDERNEYFKLIAKYKVSELIEALNSFELISIELVKLKSLVRIRKINNRIINSINVSVI